MSIENNLASIAESLAKIAEHLTKQVTTVAPAPAPVQPASVVVPAPVAAPVVQPSPVQSFAPTPAPVQPVTPPPAPAPIPQAAAPTGVPFSDAKGLIGYVMESYKAMGTEKGAHIQGVLNSLGYQNINEVRPESYPQLYAGIEALK